MNGRLNHVEEGRKKVRSRMVDDLFKLLDT